MTRKLCLLLSGAALVFSFAGTAAADSKCSDVNVQVTNKYRDPVKNAQVDIKVVDFKYWDKEDNKWRNESTTNKRIDPNQTGFASIRQQHEAFGNLPGPNRKDLDRVGIIGDLQHR